MSSTRHAKPGSPLKQNRFASSPEFETGLIANLVARRCEKLESSEDRELVWFLQLLSHQPGGLKKIGEEFREKFADRLGTREMRAAGVKPGGRYNAEQVRKIRRFNFTSEFLLQGEEPDFEAVDGQTAWGNEGVADARAAAARLPTSYPVADFVKACDQAASNLEADLKEICLNPARDLAPWYFHDLRDCLREYQRDYVAAFKAATVVTEIGSQVYDTLDYAAQSKCLVLIDGLARTGKTFAAKAWCDQHPGVARYVQVPSTNDETGFFRAIAKALGMSSGLGWKSIELRERIEDALQDGDLTLVLDEAHYCWPTQDYRHALPGRINWIMTALVNHGVAVALITTPQFIQTQKVVEKRTNWTSEQFIGRIGHYQKLPDSLTAADLKRVALVFVPEGDERSIETLVAYAQGSAKYLAGIEAIARRARYLALKDGRERVLFKDIKLAINQNVIPSDAALHQALTAPDKHSRKRLARPLQGRFTSEENPLPAKRPGSRISVAPPSESESDEHQSRRRFSADLVAG